jgi:hypothetical protein
VSEKRTSNLAVFISCAVLFVFYAVLVWTKPITQDEGVFLTIGKYLNQGWLPYLDLFDHKPPAIYFLFAGLFKLFGTSVFVIKGALILGTLGASILLKKIADVVKPGIGWYATALFLFLLTQFEGYYLIAEPFLLLPLLVGVWILMQPNADRRWLFLAGLMLGLAVLFKQTLVLTTIPFLIFAWYKYRIGVVMVLAGFVLPLAKVTVYLWFTGTLDEAWHQIVTLTLSAYPRESFSYVLNALRWNFFWTLPIWALLLLGATQRILHRKLWWAVILLPLPLMFFRHYPHYWVQVLPFVALIGAAVLMELRRSTMTIAVLIFCLAIGAGKVAQDVQPNYEKLQAQIDASLLLSQENVDVVLAENQFTAFYFLLPFPPINQFLYITEITNAVKAEQRTLDDLRANQTVLILWPEDEDFAYAKRLQQEVLKDHRDEKVFSELGMRAIILSR